MTQEIEIEYKNLLTKEEYERLLHSLPFPEEGKKQINHYFETEDFALKRFGCALRIREKDGKFQLTLKEPHPEGLLETHDWLTDQEAKSWLEGNIIPKEHTEKQLLKKNMQLEKLQYCGNLTTLRREIAYHDVLLVLDYSTYLEMEDYEFELEATSKESGIRIFQQVLEQHAIEKKNTPNKIERFFHSIGK
ncbi:CYTH domain-containing protein [Oceanobacillus saliphilus]|uniref:CYTH domain-containing protein n=1 Tax=Oceanobacillus saliphilus TaxID=2925834 RepID=UPI00201DEE50|nr:CYTH domain-containing protein [Oceanobacillus saliphilus]